MPADAQLATRSAPPALPTTRPAPPRRAPVALLVLASVLFLGYGSRTITAPFGDAHDGRNAGVWASGSRSLREQGPVESRLGTRSPEIGRYANHPPLIYVETVVAETIGTAAPAATRAPGWLGSLAVIVLLARLLRDRGLHAGAVGVAVLLAATTPMFLVYGTMLDTPVTSLPLGVGLLLLWEQGRRGAPVRPWLAGGLAALAVLAGWQGSCSPSRSAAGGSSAPLVAPALARSTSRSPRAPALAWCFSWRGCCGRSAEAWDRWPTSS